MWKKTEGGEAMVSDSAPETRYDNPSPSTNPTTARKSATIGPSISIHGDVAGEEDLTIYGSIDGTINLKNNSLVVGDKGRVTANVTARLIRVEGEVKGELRASERIVVTPAGIVNGDIRAPRVVLEDGCQFKGSIDMEAAKVIRPAAPAPSERAHAPRARPAPAAGLGSQPAGAVAQVIPPKPERKVEKAVS